METIGKTSSFISGLLLLRPERPLKAPCTFFVNTLIINKWEMVMHKKFTNSDWEMYEQILQIGSKRYEMCMILVLRANDDQLDFLYYSIYNSQVSFPWEENPTFFIDAAKFNIMEDCIKYYHLKAKILKIEEKQGHSLNGDHPIKVVSFNQIDSAKLDKFKKYLNSTKKDYLFMTFGFPWQQSYCLQKIVLNEDFYSVLPIILRHLGTLNYANDLDIMDLLSLRIAFSDIRDPSKSNALKYEIDFLIKRILANLIENNHLSISEYMIAKNSKPSEVLIFYLVYEFQNFFETLDIDDMFFKYDVDKSITLRDTIKLKDVVDVLNKLKERFNVEYDIDGKGFDKMSLSLFIGLIECQNVITIVLDTNHKWHNNVSMSEQNRIISGYKESDVDIDLRGKNTYHFIEDFVAAIKPITFVNNRFMLYIDCNLNDYRIFDNLTDATVIFECIKIDLNMLENLQQCGIKPAILLIGCSLENTCRNWELLNNLSKLNTVTINEDEGTWLSMFEFILKEIHKSNTNEFQFNSKPRFEILQAGTLCNWIDLSRVKFTVDEQNSKLEIREIYNNTIVDLYRKKFQIQQEKEPDYEFYE